MTWGCDFGYSDWPAKGDESAMPTMTLPGGLESVTRGQAWSAVPDT